MTINRRTAVRQLFLVSAGAFLLPSCLNDRSKSAILLQHFKLRDGQEELLSALTDTLIPGASPNTGDNSPGAKDISAHLFVLKMLDDCYSSNDQQRFVKGLQQLDEAARKANGSSFVKSDPAHQQAFMQALESKSVAGEDVAFCYDLLKYRTVQAYTTSPFYLTKVRVYEMIPGRYHGCVPVKTN